MGRFIIRRILSSIPVLIIVLCVSFFITHFMPGDPVRTMLGDKAPIEQVELMRHELHLDLSIGEQFSLWLSGIANRDLGNSIFWKEPIVDILIERIEPTLMLAIIATAISTLIGVPMGLMAAKHHDQFFDRVFSVFTLLSISFPAFWMAIMAVQWFCVDINIFPVAGYHGIADKGLLHSLYELALPGIVLGIMYSGQIARMTRTTLLEVMAQDYLRTARAKGISEKKVIDVHGFVNAIPPIILVVGFSFASLLGGSAVIEQLFNIPGIGNLTIAAVLKRDYPLIQGALLFIASIFIIVNMCTDILCALVNPKQRWGSYD